MLKIKDINVQTQNQKVTKIKIQKIVQTPEKLKI